jgi:hypothetical protein
LRQPVTNRARRTYFNNPLVEETLRHLPAALEHPRSTDLRDYLVQHLHHNSYSTRRKAAEYISSRFAKNGAVNLNLAAALRKFDDSKIGREILYFEYIRAIPVLQDIALRWLAELPDTGSPRAGLLSFVNARLGGRSADKVAGAAVNVFKHLGRISIPKLAYYVPVRSVPPPEAFLYILARLYPEPAMLRVETLSGENVIRAMLWPTGCVPELLRTAEIAGHISKISQLDQYHQFTLAGTGQERMRKLLGDVLPGAAPALREETASYQPAPRTAAPEPPATKERAEDQAERSNTNTTAAPQPEEPPQHEAATADQLTLFNGATAATPKKRKPKKQ